MIHITGDTHGRIDLLQKRLQKLKRGDVLLVAGDFGFVWDGTDREKKQLRRLAKRPILFIDGVNENHALLSTYPEVDFCGGRARHICGRMYQLLRGEVYTFGSASVFTFGGGESDADLVGSDEEAVKAVQPTHAEMKNGINSISERDGKIDFFVTHEAPATIRAAVTDSRGGAINEYFDRLMKMCEFRGWYFGCYHEDRSIAGVYHALYSRVLPIKGTEDFTVPKPTKERRQK